MFIPLLTAFYTTQNTKIDIEQHEPHLEKFEDTKGVIRSRKSKDRQKQWTKEKGHAMIYKILYRKIIHERTPPPTSGKFMCSGGCAVVA